MMTDWYQKSISTLQLNGKAERTQEAYTRAVRMMSAFYGKSPNEITEPELEAYLLHRRNVDHWSANTIRICYGGILFVTPFAASVGGVPSVTIRSTFR